MAQGDEPLLSQNQKQNQSRKERTLSACPERSRRTFYIPHPSSHHPAGTSPAVMLYLSTARCFQSLTLGDMPRGVTYMIFTMVQVPLPFAHTLLGFLIPGSRGNVRLSSFRLVCNGLVQGWMFFKSMNFERDLFCERTHYCFCHQPKCSAITLLLFVHPCTILYYWVHSAPSGLNWVVVYIDIISLDALWHVTCWYQ